ncbi:hypothetical protein Cs7R123_05320 [Catellatospora sp. TT07R-123]|uniref:hypothetical protein n=1 Tax=Catellatospora sp. TT07R-123 TaxID=2733863 RepID=UPI001B1F22B0|nr:hypothetical protein [Catellatospora sp. TT07R-123]GHJ43190.1 hypothetical protein Cs7R123_05320 [Catellatospora sp. TT07R-123]
MGGTSSTDEQLAVDLARVMFERIVEVEPEQSPARLIFAQQARSYLDHPARALAGQDAKGRPLQFGLTGLELLLVPVLMEASVEVLAYLGGQAVLRGGAASTAALRRLFAKTRPPGGSADAGGPAGRDVSTPAGAQAHGPSPTESGDGDLALSAAQWAEVASIVESVLVRHARMAPERADRLAVAVVGEGVLRGSGR